MKTKDKKQIIKEEASPRYLPQLSAPFTDIVNGLEQENISWRPVIVRVGQLKPLQNTVEVSKMKDISQEFKNAGEYNMDPVFISNDDYILDGHHRTAGLINSLGKDAKVKCIRIDLDEKEAVRTMNKIEDIYEYKQKNNKNVKRLKKSDLEEYAKKVIEQNLEEIDLNDDDTMNHVDLLDEYVAYAETHHEDVTIYNFIDFTDREYPDIDPKIVRLAMKDVEIIERENEDNLGRISENDLEEGPRTHSSLRTQRLKSQPEKQYAKSRIRPAERDLSEENIEQEKNYVVSAFNRNTNQREILNNPSTREEAEGFKRDYGKMGMGKYSDFQVEPRAVYDAKMERHRGFEDFYSLNEKDISEDKINKYLKLKEKYDIKGLPSEELDLNEQERFMEEFNLGDNEDNVNNPGRSDEINKKNTVRLSEIQLKEIVEKLKKEYATPSVPIANEMPSM